MSMSLSVQACSWPSEILDCMTCKLNQILV